MSTAVVVPNWNGAALLGECLDSLARQTLEHQTIVVDNGSTDGSLTLLRERYPDVTVVALPHNQGFAGGVNRGIEAALAAGHDLVALLNNDAVADPQWLARLVDAAEAHPGAGIVQAKLLAQDRRHLDSTGDCYSLWGLAFPRGRGELDTGQYDDARDLFAASGGASLYRAALLREVGCFDEDFFAYFEDVDLSFRAQLAGWSVRYEPGAVVYHRIGGTSERLPDFARFHILRNLVFVYVKNMPGPLLRRSLPRFLLLYAAMALSGLVRGHARVTLRALAAAARRLPTMLARRRQVQATRSADPGRLEALLDQDLPPGQEALSRLVRWGRLVSLSRAGRRLPRRRPGAPPRSPSR